MSKCKCKWTKELLENAVRNNVSIAGVCRDLNIRPVGGNYKTIHYYINEYNLDTSHFTGSAWNQGTRYRNICQKRSLDDILTGKANLRSSYHLKLRLLNEGVKEYRCENCGKTTWLNKPIPLELHHLNGNNLDNRIENLQLLCPNCHALTDNYRVSKTQSALSERREVEYRKFKETLTGNADGNLEPSFNNKEGAETRHDKPKSKKVKNPKYCAYCGIELTGQSYRNKYCSQECAHKANGSKRPSVIELLEKFKELKSYVQVSKYYKVSDNAIRKWVKLYQIEDMVKE